jgi:hypothetical protein
MILNVFTARLHIARPSGLQGSISVGLVYRSLISAGSGSAFRSASVHASVALPLATVLLGK